MKVCFEVVRFKQFVPGNDVFNCVVAVNGETFCCVTPQRITQTTQLIFGTR